MQSFNDITHSFETFLSEQNIFPQTPRALYGPCEYILAAGGKRVRPAVCIMAAELFGSDSRDAYYAAAAYELFHNFTLIHDDIMDAAPLRRGRATIHERWGLATGILSGDVMSIYAYYFLGQISAAHLPAVFHLFNKTAIEVCEGQQIDMDFEKMNDVTVDQYLYMISLKTAVLLAASLQSGAILANATESDALHLYEFGKNVGIAFQLQDDYLDSFGDHDKTGKQRGGDIKAGKKTILWSLANELTDAAGRKELKRLNDLPPHEKVIPTLALYEKSGVKELTKQKIEEYTNQAFDSLGKIGVEHSKKEPLVQLAQLLLVREY